jgi:riboflavin synthase
MFTGIIEGAGKVERIVVEGSGKHFWLSGPFTQELGVDESLAHDGVCLTVAEKEEATGYYRVTAIEETLQRTTLDGWQVGHRPNLERAMRANGRFDGHIVQGHADAKAVLESVDARDGSWLCRFSFPRPYAELVVEKGSVCLNGVSLTAFGLTEASLQVAIIPYTWEHTNLAQLKAGMEVNIEFDILGKYLLRRRELAG